MDVADRIRDARKVGELEVAWKVTATPDEAIDEEARLLRHCYWDRFELPPANRSEPVNEVRKAIQYLSESTSSPAVAENAIEFLRREERLKKRG